MAMDQEIHTCLECKKDTEVIVDHMSGDVICSECGLVFNSHYIEDSAEWRTFADDGNNDRDPNRVGAATNPFLDGNLTTVIVNPKSISPSNSMLRFKNAQISNPDKPLLSNFETLATIADRLGLVATIKNRACQIYKEVEEKKCLRGRKILSVIAACLHLASKEEKLTRTFKEISEATANGISTKEILKAEKMIEKETGINVNKIVSSNNGGGTGQHNYGVEDLVRRFCSNLGMGHLAIKAVQEAYQKSEAIDIRRNPHSILAAIIYAVSQLTDDNKQKIRDVARIAGVAEGTIRKCLRDLNPDFPKLIPAWFAQPQDISFSIRSH
ncbi:transcription initiation factor IIB-2-like [Rutidosis leptorrhynchoides]|uniref:transcription initiation factor IIB-2-like n=1 Tax=Rutidosis leptorrhynchoides TaxID=125765 RepID=UPI003A992906